MAYRPTNNIQENVIHRNTIFDSQGMVSCCTCGYCIEKTQDPSLTLTNFKAATPLINEQSIGSTIVEFSDYMIPTGSFDYVLTPYQTTDTFADGTNATNLKFADSLVYYPFLKCNGITTLKPNEYYYGFSNPNAWPLSLNVNGLPTKTQKPYASEFAKPSYSQVGTSPYVAASNGLQQTPSYYPSLINNVSTVSNIVYADQIFFDSQFGSFIANSYYLYDGFNYSNTSFNRTFYNAGYLYYPASTPEPIQSNYYKWGDASTVFFTSYLLKNITFISKDSQFEFSTKYSFGIESILNNGITPNLSRYYGQLYPYTIITPQQYFNYTSHIDIFDLSNFKDKNSFWLDELGKKLDYFNWISSGGSIPCNGTQLQNIAANTNYNVTNYTTEKPYPSTVDIGNYETYLSYVDAHEFSHLGFKSDSSCSNNISKLISPVYFKSVDDYSFSYTHPNYTKTNSVFGITDKFIIPDFQTWQDCLSDATPATKTLPAKTVQLKEMNSTDNIYKGGYVLDKFQINKYGTFNGTISITARNDFFATGLESVWNLKKSLVYDGGQSCTYFSNKWDNNVAPVYNQFNVVEHAVFDQTLIQENEFIKATPTTYIDYYNQVETGFYTNGSFNYYSSGIPVTYYEDVCRGYIQQPNSLALPISYVAQKTDRTKITSVTDGSGKTTTTIRNVLWVGKTLLTNTYTHNSGANRPNLASGKVPLTYDAILKGGFESDIIVSFQSKSICSIFNIADELKRVTQFKVNFENYQKPPQQNFAVNDYTQEIVNASPDIPASFVIGNFSTTNSIFPFNQTPITYYKSFDNIAFGIPNTNPNEYFYIQKEIQKPTSPYNYQPHEDWSLVKNIQEISPTFAYYSASAGRVYPDFGVPDRFKSCLLINGGEDVWATGNEITILDNANTFYSIYMEEIKDEKQTAGQSLIRIATTLQNANDGIYIPNAGSTSTYNRSLTVKFLSTHKDFSKLDAPRYDVFNPNSLSTANQNANDRGITYSVTGAFTTPVTQQINIRMNPAIQTPSGGHFFLPSTYPLINFGLLMNYQAYGNTSTKPSYADPTAPLSTYIDNQFVFYDRLEVISLSPLKLKYVNMKFVYNDAINVKQYNLQYTPPNLTLINANGQCFWGFQCDIIMEEVVDEFIEEALPVEFNQILENVEYIQTSNLMNSRTPMQMINPEQCEHIGKVIDRKDCNCPKKWVRLCDIHGKTDWKKCMQCKDFKVSE
jgi:hypothetical protein